MVSSTCRDVTLARFTGFYPVNGGMMRMPAVAHGGRPAGQSGALLLT